MDQLTSLFFRLNDSLKSIDSRDNSRISAELEKCNRIAGQLETLLHDNMIRQPGIDLIENSLPDLIKLTDKTCREIGNILKEQSELTNLQIILRLWDIINLLEEIQGEIDVI